MIKKIIDIFTKYHVKNFVVEKELSNHCMEGVILFNDVRSATFYAFGESLKKNEPVVLIVSGNNLPNVYTGITEAWFQKANVIIVAIYSHYKEIKCAYMERCVLEYHIYDENELMSENNLMNIVEKKGPVLINLIVKIEEELLNNYYDILKVVNNVVEQKTDVFAYNAEKNFNQLEKINIRNIEPQYKYGIFSKYIGFIAGGGNAILCCSSKNILLDANIFRTRYSSNNIKIIIHDKDNIINEYSVDKWITSNKWNYSETEEINEEIINNMLRLEKPSVLVVNRRAK